MKIFDEIPFIEKNQIVIGKIRKSDADGLSVLVNNPNVYRYLPTFLFEKKYTDMDCLTDKIYSECFGNRESVITGIYLKKSCEFCGIAEFYGFNDNMHKISIGYRLREEYWGQGIATEAVALMIEYLYRTDIEIITASTMIENKASAEVLRKNGFIMTAHGVPEDWGYESPTLADKWFL
ncbi:MAG: GNAT family N-acetyltransferase [Ruminococcus sp.]|nr:GNAT family N-acetyltransferase [Ruminococcus sp.]